MTVTLTRYFTFESGTGRVVMRGSASRERLPNEAPEGHGLVIVEDGRIPRDGFRVDRRKIPPAGITIVSSLDGKLLDADKTQILSSRAAVEERRIRAIAGLDDDYARRLAEVRGPLADLHAEKRRQAEAGVGPLVADETDRLAILANAARQDEAVAAIELKRRAIKAALKAATTEDEIKAALAMSNDPKEAFQ